MWSPEQDGVDHVNVYSRGRTALGRWLSNFAEQPMDTEDGRFLSVEGYWYWLSKRDDRLRELHGFAAKNYGRQLPDYPGAILPTAERFRAKIERALHAKAQARPDMLAELQRCELPLAHYYVFDQQVKDAGYRWILDIWDAMRSWTAPAPPHRRSSLLKEAV